MDILKVWEMIDYKIQIKKENIVITIKKPPRTGEEDYETLESLKHDLDLKSFIDWIDWMPIHPRDEEWVYWEAKAGTISPLGEIRYEFEKKNKELNEENGRLIKENKELLKQVKDLEQVVEKKSWPAKSRVIALEEENQKLKNRLSAFESPTRGRKKK